MYIICYNIYWPFCWLDAAFPQISLEPVEDAVISLNAVDQISSDLLVVVGWLPKSNHALSLVGCLACCVGWGGFNGWEASANLAILSASDNK